MGLNASGKAKCQLVALLCSNKGMRENNFVILPTRRSSERIAPINFVSCNLHKLATASWYSPASEFRLMLSNKPEKQDPSLFRIDEFKC